MIIVVVVNVFYCYAFVFEVGSLQMRYELCNVPTVLAALQ